MVDTATITSRHQRHVITLRFKTLIGAVLLSAAAASAVDIELAKELPCIRPQPDVARNVDFRWMLSVERWYIPLQSTLSKYRLAETLLEIPVESLTTSHLSQNASCLQFKWDTAHPTLYGNEGQEVAFMVTPLYENSFGFKGLSHTSKRGRSYITLRDNETFVFFTTCWEDEQASWHVISTRKVLPESTINDIRNHATSLGFKETHFAQPECSSTPEQQDSTLLESQESNQQPRNEL